MATTSSTAAPTRRAIAGRSSSDAVSQGCSPSNQASTASSAQASSSSAIAGAAPRGCRPSELPAK